MKLLKVEANNFKLCEDNFNISFIPKANKKEEDKEFELNEIDENLFTYSTLGIVGKNASGKTTSVELLAVVYDIISNFRIKNTTNILKYNNKTINLKISFYHNGFLYYYKTDLYKRNDGVEDNIILFKNQIIYQRQYKKTYTRDLFNYQKYQEINTNVDLPEDTSLLYTILRNINIRGIYYSSQDTSFHNYALAFNIYKLLDNDEKIIKAILKMFDEHISSIEMINENKYQIIYNNNEIKEVTNQELYNILSSGTTKGIGLYTFVVFSLKNGCDLIIDEIENHFHKTLVENLINLYKDKTVNKKNATLIFTTHYCELLDLFNRNDNIYISKYDKKIKLENMYEDYKLRPDLLKSNKFYQNAFNTNVNYQSLMNFKKELM